MSNLFFIFILVIGVFGSEEFVLPQKDAYDKIVKAIDECGKSADWKMIAVTYGRIGEIWNSQISNKDVWSTLFKMKMELWV